MATFRLKRFSRPDTLKAISPDFLSQFLAPYHEYLQSRGVGLPLSYDTDSTFDLLTQVFLSPDAQTPRELVDSLYLVDEMSGNEEMDSLMGEAKTFGVSLTFESCTPIDIAIQIWLAAPDIIAKKHAERFLCRARSFESYQLEPTLMKEWHPLSQDQLNHLTEDLDRWFEHKNRGRGTRIFLSEHQEAVWFLVRHGEPFKREESLDGRETTSVCYRPLKYDAVVYEAHKGELRINARSKGEKQLYRTVFAKYLFGDETLFSGQDKYCLSPLREQGEAALVCTDIPGLEQIRLKELQLFHGGSSWELETRKSDDLFALYRKKGRPFPTTGQLVKATFKVYFSDSPTPRSVVIKPGNVAQYMRDEDCDRIEQWLKARGFISSGLVPEEVCDERLLAST